MTKAALLGTRLGENICYKSMKKILFVEDEPILIKTYGLAFEQAGYEVKINVVREVEKWIE